MKELIFSNIKNSVLLVTLLLGMMSSISEAAVPFRKKEFSKKIEKTFDISSDGKVDLNNRYGQVTVKTWDQNKVEITIIITVSSKDEEAANETFDRIDIEFSNSANYVSAATHIESKSSSASWFNWIVGNSYSSDDYSIHYTVQMPSSNNLSVANKYGNTAVEDIEGDVDMTIKYGNVDMGNVGGDFSLDLGYGNATLGNSGNADVTIKYGNFKMKNANDLRIESKYSKMKIEEVRDVRSQTKYDTYNIGQIRSLRNAGKYDHFDIEYLEDLEIETKYTDVDIDNLKQSADVVMSHGGLNIRNLEAGFRDLRLEGRYTDFKIGVSGAFQLDGQSTYGGIRYPDGMKIQIDKEKSNEHEVEGYRGSKDSGMIKARLDYGSLKVY
jgi:hypothetical protein